MEPSQEKWQEPQLSNHTISIRKAILYCDGELFRSKASRRRQRQQQQQHPTLSNGNYSSSNVHQSHNDEANDDAAFQRRRRRNRRSLLLKDKKDDLLLLWPSSISVPPSSIITTANMSFQIPILDLRNPYDDIESSSPLFFRTHYLETNQPCLIRGLSLQYFASLDQQWRRLPISSPSLQSSSSDSTSPKWQVNYDWFRQHVGPSEIVPLRVAETIVTSIDAANAAPSANTETEDLDDMGRAKECRTQRVPLDEWIHMLQQQSHDESMDHINSDNSRFYLKDWHLQLHLEQRQRQEEKLHREEEKSTSDATTSADPFVSSVPPLYQVPPHFEYDLLNHFLLQFCDHKSDYRFCYWGPRHSYTGWHTDVLQSYSWSYNVVGRKQWTFRVPHPNQDAIADDTPPTAPALPHLTNTDTITIIQEAGDCIFVPSQWQHYVINLEETLSVNHNWITTANLPACWECLLQELYAVQDEMKAWGIDQDSSSMINSKGPNNSSRETTSSNVWDWEALENMLRGCVGLDVTSFVWMMFTRLVDLVVHENEGDDDLGSEALPSYGSIDKNFSDRDTFQPGHHDEIAGQSLDQLPAMDRAAACQDHVPVDRQHYYNSLDVMRLATMLQTVWTHPDANAKERMKAVVQCPELSARGVQLITDLLNDELGTA